MAFVLVSTSLWSNVAVCGFLDDSGIGYPFMSSNLSSACRYSMFPVCSLRSLIPTPTPFWSSRRGFALVTLAGSLSVCLLCW